MQKLKKILTLLRKKNKNYTNFTQANCDITIGRYTYGWEHASILNWGEEIKIQVGSFCSISAGLKIYTGGNHRADWLTTYPFGHIFSQKFGEPVRGHPASKGNISIGHDVWIGRDVTLMSGIIIGDGSIIAANSHVVSHVPPFSIFGGNPAKLIRKRFNDEVIAKLQESEWWNFSDEEIKKMIPILCCQNGKTAAENASILVEHINRKNEI